ncbi:alpha/beta hydrolase [Verrucomicrobia bacterium]|nr:alpha/beta hydrolase [Verrucomicrobiota bacterium]
MTQETINPKPRPVKRRTRCILLIGAIVAITLGMGCIQRKLLYFPTHHENTNGLSQWSHEDQVIGYARKVPAPKNVWLMLHGNAGQAAGRGYALPSFSEDDSVFILEYPGYGKRKGTPSMKSFNTAATEAYEILRSEYSDTPVCIAGESIGSGPSCFIASSINPPDKVVIVVPFDNMASVATEHVGSLLTTLLLRDKWDNINALKDYDGPLEIYGAKKDTVIPIHHARALAESRSQAKFHEIEGGHNDWSHGEKVKFRYSIEE